MNRSVRIGILVASVAIFCYAGIGHVLGRTSDDRAYKSLTVYGEVLQKIQTDYVDEPNMHLVTAGSLHGLLESLDPESSYLTPREYTEYKQKLSNQNEGETGLNLSKRVGWIMAVSVLPDSPADKAGIRSGDIFESVGGFSSRDMSDGQALNLLDGQPGSKVKVSVIRQGKVDPEEVELTRQKLAEPKIIVQRNDPDVLVMRMLTLDAGRAEEIRSKLANAENEGVHKVILDLRECGRGPTSEALAVAKLFIGNGTLATVKGQTVSKQTFAADPASVVWKNPVSLLTDGSTSGAAEVLASAFAATHRGDVVGGRTFGLASEQKLITLDDGSALFLTVANYYNADGKAILEEGVVPTEVVQASAADEDSDEAAAPKPAPAGPGAGKTEEIKPLSAGDIVLRKALQLLNAPAPAKKAA